MKLFQDIVTFFTKPEIYFVMGVLFLVTYILFRRTLTSPKVALGMLLFGVAFFVVSFFDEDFRKIVTKPDNVPIAAMLFFIGFFMWLSLRRAVNNDEATARGEPTLEASESKQKILVWPDLVYTEFICLILCTALLLVWSIGLHAPLEQPANPNKTTNPSKAPWYFLGLQEMLVYYDPWLAGVVLPGLIIVGLMAVPYIDPNPRGNGYYTFKERPFAISMFLFGFLVLWISLIILGTFLRGPNWNFFGPYDFWDVHKVAPLVNVNLSEFFWVRWLGQSPPKEWWLRESVGIALVLGYLLVLPPLLAKTAFRKMLVQMGFARYNVMVLLFLVMMSLPLKMVLRWTLNLKYIVAIPEFFFNI